jgi:hypothetical protein
MCVLMALPIQIHFLTHRIICKFFTVIFDSIRKETQDWEHG